MSQLIFGTSNTAKEGRYLIQKAIVTVGTEAIHDLVLPSTSSGIIFTLNQKLVGSESQVECVPVMSKVKVNGQAIFRSTRLRGCDRIEWSGGVAVFLESSLSAQSTPEGSQAIRSLKVLQNLASTLQNQGNLSAALHQALAAVVEMAGAEVGYLVSESASKSGWDLVASQMQHSGDSSQFSPKKKELFSNTILQEAIKKKEPVCVENIIGHPWADAASVIEARIFSVACLPLSVGERVFGAIFLFTRSPGKSIRKEVLTELNLFATQAALMMASQAELRETRHENAKLRSLVPQVPTGLVFDSSSTNPMAEVARKISKLAPTPLNVLILGETGTGKEVVAREIHQQSTRAKKPFIAVNCAAIPGALLEATLFGHERGAFTGAVKAHEGKFLAAHGGTLLLDEIGDLPLELQSKLLRVLQEKLVEPLGSSRPIPVDVRILAATHQNLEEAVRAGRFRQDLFFRLNGSILKLPPLRERKEDLLVLAEHFLKQTGRDVQFSTEAFSALKKHSWPGNVRELEQVVQRAGLLCEGSEITAQDLELSEKFGSSLDSEAAEAELFSNLEKAQWGFTQEYVQRALAKYKGSRSEVAERLGISERTLYRILATQASGASGTSGKSV